MSEPEVMLEWERWSLDTKGKLFHPVFGEFLIPRTLVDAIAALKTEKEKAEADYRFMVERAADKHLEGYRELGQKAAEAEIECDRLRAENAVLRKVAEAAHEVAHRSERVLCCDPDGEGLLRDALDGFYDALEATKGAKPDAS